MLCKKCGHNFEGNFCPNCGKKVNVVNESFKEVPVKPKPVAKPQFNKEDPVELINKFVRKQIRIWFLTLWLIIAALQFGFTVLVISNYDLNTLTSYSFLTHILQLVIVGILIVFELVVGLLLISKYRLKTRNEQKCYKTLNITLAQVIWFIFVVLAILYVVVTAINTNTYNIVPIYLTIIMFIYSLTINSLTKEIRTIIYGKPKVKNGDSVVVRFDELNKEYLSYVQYKQELKEYNYLIKCYNTQKSPSSTGKKLSKLDNNVIKISGAVLISVFLFCLIPLSALGFNKFSISNAQLIEINKTEKSIVKSIFGAPDDGEEDDLAWYYYENSYLKLLNKMESLDEKMESVTSFSELESLDAEYEKLEEQLDSLIYKELNINFDQSGYATSVWLNTTTTSSYSSSNDKTLSSYNVISESLDTLNTTATIVYEATYTDGSYTKASTSIILTQEAIDDAGSSIEVEWSDRRGNFEATLEL